MKMIGNDAEGSDKLSETVEEVPLEKPKRKIWKAAVLAVIVILVVSTVAMYVYAYNALGETLSESFGTIYVSDIRLENMNLFPPSADVIAEYTIENPTGTSIRLAKVDFNIWVDGKSIGTLTATDKSLSAGGSTVLTATIHIGSEAIAIMTIPPYTMKFSGEVVASTNILFLTVTRTYSITETQTIT